MAIQFQEVMHQALTTEYAEIFDRCPELKVATLVRNRSESFNAAFEHYAHTHEWNLGGVAPCQEVENATTYKVRCEPNPSGLDDIIGDLDKEVDVPEQGETREWLKDLYHNSRGFELGTFQPAMLSHSMRKQSVKWETIAMGYISDVIAIVHKFIVILLEHVWPDNTVRGELMIILMEKLAIRYREAIDYVIFSVQVEREGPGTLNTNFNMAL